MGNTCILLRSPRKVFLKYFRPFRPASRLTPNLVNSFPAAGNYLRVGVRPAAGGKVENTGGVSHGGVAGRRGRAADLRGDTLLRGGGGRAVYAPSFCALKEKILLSKSRRVSWKCPRAAYQRVAEAHAAWVGIRSALTFGPRPGSLSIEWSD